MYNRLYKYLTCKKILYPQQFGFQKDYSTEHVTPQIVDQIYESFENKNYTVDIFLDFDYIVDYITLLEKLEIYETTGANVPILEKN